MSGMFQDMIQSELDDQINTRYPHLKHPIATLARVTESQPDGIDNYIVALKILDKNMQDNADYPEVPQVKTKIPLKEKEIAVVVLLYGEANPYVLGRWEE